MRVHTNDVAVGGDAVARTSDGKIVFVRGALPHESVQIELTEQRKDFDRGYVVNVDTPSPFRVQPTCVQVARGCGGCGWQHVSLAGQREMKERIVAEALRRGARIRDADQRIVPSEDLTDVGFRTTLRVAIADGRCAFRAAASNELVPIDSCAVAHPALVRILADGVFPGGQEASLRVGIASGDVVVVVTPSADGVVLPDLVEEGLATSVIVVSADTLQEEQPFHREVVDGVQFEVSAESFFQTRRDGAEALVRAVSKYVDPARADLLLDLYGGVGLFAGTVGRLFTTVVSVESSESASADADANFANFAMAETAATAGGPNPEVETEWFAVNADIDRWLPDLDEVSGRHVTVIADPSRAGLGRSAVERIVRLEPAVIILVSCDAGSLGRDARLLEEAGFLFVESTMVDLFPHTPHVEVVSLFVPNR